MSFDPEDGGEVMGRGAARAWIYPGVDPRVGAGLNQKSMK
jgi:hypothetical protein